MLLSLLPRCGGLDLVSDQVSDQAAANNTVIDASEGAIEGASVANPVPIIDTIRDETPHVTYMRAHIGIPDKDTINKWLHHVGLPPGNPFCSAMASYALTVSGVTSPSVRSGLARNFVHKTHHSMRIAANDVYKGFIEVPAGSMVVYQRGETVFGHNGFTVQRFTGPRGVYISGNTSKPGAGGSESAGGGVYEKEFNINPYSYFKITDFIHIESPGKSGQI